MRIVKMKHNGSIGKAVVKASTVERMRAFEDEYCVVLKATGLNEAGDAVTHLVTLTRNELALLNRQ